jgi:plastocyanin
MRHLTIIVPFVVAAVVAGCGSSSSGGGSVDTAAGASSGGGQLTLSESEFKITPAAPTVASTGTITITVKNAGAITHALSVQTPSGTVSTGKIAPGASATLKVNASKAGRYTFFCPIPGHRAAGMQGVLVVGSAGAGSGIVNSTTISKTYQPSGY